MRYIREAGPRGQHALPACACCGLCRQVRSIHCHYHLEGLPQRVAPSAPSSGGEAQDKGIICSQASEVLDSALIGTYRWHAHVLAICASGVGFVMNSGQISVPFCSLHFPLSIVHGIAIIFHRHQSISLQQVQQQLERWEQNSRNETFQPRSRHPTVTRSKTKANNYESKMNVI